MPLREPKLPTRDRILESCRILFNERGPQKVTTSDIAEAVGISEGNLHYHFQRKKQIVEALFDRFASELDRAAAAATLAGFHSAQHGRYLDGWFETMWEWRLFYTAVTYHLAPSLRPRLSDITQRGQAQIARMLQGMAAEGLLAASPAQVESLVVNAWIVASSWIDYVGARQGVDTVSKDHLAWGRAQVEALFVPYMPAPTPAELANA